MSSKIVNHSGIQYDSAEVIVNTSILRRKATNESWGELHQSEKIASTTEIEIIVKGTNYMLIIEYVNAL